MSDLHDKLSSIISGYRINSDDAAWLSALSASLNLLKAQYGVCKLDADGQRKRVDALLAENERLKGIVEAQGNTMMEAITRTNAAERKFKALCEAEPVALLCIDGDHRCLMCDDDAALNALPHGTALIPRPSMEKN